MVVDDDVAAEDVRAALEAGAGELLESIALFDVFTGEQVGEGKKSLTFSLRFRADRPHADRGRGHRRPRRRAGSCDVDRRRRDAGLTARVPASDQIGLRGLVCCRVPCGIAGATA